MFDIANHQVSDKKERKMKELALKIEKVDTLLAKILEQHDISLPQLNALLSGLPPEMQSELDAAKEELDKTLHKEINSVADRSNVQSTYQDLKQIQQTWMFVR